MTFSAINSLSRDEFVRVIGPVFERSPWIAELTWHRAPFASAETLHTALCETVARAGETKQVQLIQAHPDLVGRAAQAGTLTAESSREQAAAGLDRLDAAEIRLFRRQNRAYRAKFGFPFVICARLNKKAAILAGFDTRLQNTREQEIKAALDEIGKIALLRLGDLLAGKAWKP